MLTCLCWLPKHRNIRSVSILPDDDTLSMKYGFQHDVKVSKNDTPLGCNVLSFNIPRIGQVYIKVHLGPSVTEICWSRINQANATLLDPLVSWGFSGRYGLCKPEHSMSTKRVPGCWDRLERVRIASNQLSCLVCWMMTVSVWWKRGTIRPKVCCT